MSKDSPSLWQSLTALPHNVWRSIFRNLEDAKYQMFWSDVEELVESGKTKESRNGDEQA